jgi:hypothetical protein
MSDIQGVERMSPRVGSRLGVRLGSVLAGMLLSGLAAGQEAAWTVNPALQDQVTLQLGAFVPTVNTTAHLNGSGGRLGTSISFEDDLGFSDRATLGSIFAGIRFAERWKFEAEYFALNRSNSHTVSRTINWGDHTFPINTTVNGKFDSPVYRMGVGYSFVKDQQSEFGVALGLFATDFSLSLSAPVAGTQSGQVLAPLPTIGLYGAYAFSPRWLLSGRVDYFSLKHGDYDGSLTNFAAGIDYRFTRNFGVGAGYRYMNYDLTSTKAKYNGGVEYKFSGPTLYAAMSF